VVEDVAVVDGGAVEVGEPYPDGDLRRGRPIGEVFGNRSPQRHEREHRGASHRRVPTWPGREKLEQGLLAWVDDSFERAGPGAEGAVCLDVLRWWGDAVGSDGPYFPS
jgi:hypothetical protein